MNYLQDLLIKKNRQQCPIPLWKLQLTEDEFNDLKGYITNHYNNGRNRRGNPFMCICKECALYFAEYWQRLYDGRAHNKLDVFTSLKLNVSKTEEKKYSDYFFEAAKKGGKFLGIERYTAGRNEQNLEDLLYQGGLPLAFLKKEDVYANSWYRLFLRLVDGRISFEDLKLGDVANNSKSIADYCRQVVKALQYKKPDDMPCADIEVYNKLEELASRERQQRAASDPFLLEWIFCVNKADKKLSVRYSVSGPNKLSDNFLSDNGLTVIEPFSIHVRKNDCEIKSFDYMNNLCRERVECKHVYADEDVVSIYINNSNEPYKSEGLNLNTPHLVIMKNDGDYALGSQVGLGESILLIPQGWTLQDNHGLSQDTYTWCGKNIAVVEIPSDFEKTLVVTGVDGQLCFGPQTQMYWTGVLGYPKSDPLIITPTFRASELRFTMYFDTADGVECKKNKPVQYRGLHSTSWGTTPEYGKIYARAVDNQHFVTPVPVINVGDGIDIKVLKADANECRLKIKWSHGTVHSSQAQLVQGGNSEWLIQKTDCQDKGCIKFTFTPVAYSNNAFDLLIRVPFRDFYIFDEEGTKLADKSIIPYEDLDRYYYHLMGQNVTYSFGDTTRKLVFDQSKNLVTMRETDNGAGIMTRLATLLPEGPITALLSTRRTIKLLLERTGKGIKGASVKVSFTPQQGKGFEFSVMEYPYRLKQDGNKITVHCVNDKNVIFPYTGGINYIKLDDPKCEPICTYHDAPGHFTLPSEVQEWDKSIAFGRVRGRILPRLINKPNQSTAMTESERWAAREAKIKELTDDFSKASLGNALWQRSLDWFEACYKYGIPASSILELVCIGKDEKNLLRFLFQLFVRSKTRFEADDALFVPLLNLSNDLNFQWYWLAPYIEPYTEWYTENITSDFQTLIDLAVVLCGPEKTMFDLLVKFKEWLRELCIESAIESYDLSITANGCILLQHYAENAISQNAQTSVIPVNATVDVNQNNIDQKVKEFYNNYSEPGRPVNENWLMQRVNATSAHLRKEEINLFKLEDNIRSSAIHCAKLYTTMFLSNLCHKVHR